MADLLKTGAEWLSRQIKTHVSRALICRRGAASATLTATVGSSILRVGSGQYGQAQVIRTDRDYLISAEDYVLSGSVVEPEEGDRYDDAIDGRVYECLPPAPGEPAWRYSDNRRTKLRIHVKDVGAL